MIRFLTLLFGGLISYASAFGQCEGQAPGASAFGGVLTCASQTVTLQGNSPTPGVVYSWVGPNDFFSNEQNPEISETGTYFLEVRNPVNGCSSVTFVVVVQNYDEPGAAANGGTIPCEGSAVQLTALSLTPGVEYTWSGPEGFISNKQNPVVSIPGTYYLVVTNPLTGCESVDMVTVESVSATCVFSPVAINDLNITVRENNVTGKLLTNDYHPYNFPLVAEGFRRHGQSGSFESLLSIPGQGEFILTDPSAGAYVFQPVPGFSGITEPVEYQVCDTETGQCNYATLRIDVIDDKVANSTPVAIDDHFQTALGASFSGVFLANDFDADGDALTLNMISSSGISSLGGTWSINPDQTFDYTPMPGFTGLDSLFQYEICDGISGCDIAVITALVLQPGAENSNQPSAVDDVIYTRRDLEVSGNLFDNDLAGQNAEIVNISTINGTEVSPFGTTIITANGGTATVFQDGSFSYSPAIGMTGNDKFEYVACNENSFCDNATIYFLILPPSCITPEIWVYLEGPYQASENRMSTTLNIGRSILPGQIPFNATVEPTPPGNPYREAPWNYSGIPEEENYNGPYINSLGKAVTDWVLVTFRADVNPETEIAKATGLVYEDGRIVFIDPCVLRASDPQDIWIVIEHRNHMGVMSDSAVHVQGGKLIYDFRQTDSYETVSSFGQKEVAPGVWAMYAGDADQTDSPGFDINGTDNIIWSQENGNFDRYLLGDFDLNGDINGADNILYSTNNGVSSSVLKE